MPVTFQILPDFNLVLARFHGEVGTEEHIASFEEYARHPLFDCRQHALVDLSDCTLDDAYFDDMQRLAYRLKDYYAVRALSSKTAVYAPGDVVFGMSRMYQSIADGVSPWEIGVFRRRERAMGFLGIRPQTPQALRLREIWDNEVPTP